MKLLSKKIEKECKNCKTIFVVKNYRPCREGTIKYCSNRCQVLVNARVKKGTTLTEKTKKRMSVSKIKTQVSKPCLFCLKSFIVPAWRADAPFCSHFCYGESKKGKSPSLETRLKMSISMKGKNTKYEVPITPLHLQIRASIEYRLWREAVFARDNFTCQICKKRGGRLNADHIKQFAFFPELRFAIDNGRTLCEPCHKKTPTWGAKGKSK